VTPGTGGAAK